MTTTTITRDRWEAFADATLDHDNRAARMGRELAASTPPIVLAKRARHRKPNRRRGVIARVAGTALLVAAIFGSIAVTPRTATQAPAFYGLTPGQASQVATMLQAPGYQLVSYVTATPNAEAHACHEATVLHEHRLQGAYVPQRAVDAVKIAARGADRELGTAILHYVRTDRGWLEVWSACNPDA